MKRKLFSIAMAVVMTVACLTGCSGSGEFSKSSFIGAAKKSGMKEIEDTTELTHMFADPGEHIAFYYDDKGIKVMEYVGSPLSDHVSKNDAKEFALAVESIGATEDHGRCTTRIFYLTVKDDDMAEDIYNSVKRGLVKPEEGKKNGVTYTISYQGPTSKDDSTVELAIGVYLIDNHVVWIRSDYDATLKNKTVETFCKSLGVVSPYTLS